MEPERGASRACRGARAGFAAAALALVALAPRPARASSFSVSAGADYRLYSVQGLAVDVLTLDFDGSLQVGRLGLSAGLPLRGIGSAGEILQLGPVTTLRRSSTGARWLPGDASFSASWRLAGVRETGLSVSVGATLQVPLPGLGAGDGLDAIAALSIGRPAAIGGDFLSLAVGAVGLAGPTASFGGVDGGALAVGVSGGSVIVVASRWGLGLGGSVYSVDRTVSFGGRFAIVRALGRDSALSLGVSGGAMAQTKHLGVSFSVTRELWDSDRR